MRLESKLSNLSLNLNMRFSVDCFDSDSTNSMILCKSHIEYSDLRFEIWDWQENEGGLYSESLLQTVVMANLQLPRSVEAASAQSSHQLDCCVPVSMLSTQIVLYIVHDMTNTHVRPSLDRWTASSWHCRRHLIVRSIRRPNLLTWMFSLN